MLTINKLSKNNSSKRSLAQLFWMLPVNLNLMENCSPPSLKARVSEPSICNGNKKLGILVLGLALIILYLGLVLGIADEKIYTGDYFSNQQVYDSNIPLEVSEEIAYQGYIVEFEKEPLALKWKGLKELSKENEKKIETMSFYNPLKYSYMLFATRENDIPRLLESYENKLENNKAKVKNKILEKLNKKSYSLITGNVVAEDKLGILSEWNSVFNGIALDITDQEAEEVKNLKGVKSVSPNLKVHITLMDSVGLIDANYAWNFGFMGNNMKIGIIDTGVDYTHEDLGGCFGPGCKVEGGYDFVNKDVDPIDDQGHGTHCAGTAAGNGELKGVAPNAKIYAYKVLNNWGSGSFANLISAIERAVDPNQDGDYKDHLDVISLSLGRYCGKNYNENCGPDDPASKAIDNAVEAGVIAVVAAGNEGSGEKTIRTPGTARKAITVGASCKPADFKNHNYCNEIIASFSSRGPVEWLDSEGNQQYLIKPDVVAPGVNICAAQWDNAWESKKCFDNKHVAISGTSMATPHVAGAVALIKQAYPNYTPEQIKELLKATSDDLGYNENTQGKGKVNVKLAIGDKKIPVVDIKTQGIVREDALKIIGTVKSDNFQDYTLYYKESQEDSWTELYKGYREVDNDILYQDTSFILIEEKNYFFRLVLKTTDQKEYSDSSNIKLVNTEILSPKNIDIKRSLVNPRDRLEIFGTARGINFENYQIEYCTEDLSCSNNGIILIEGGQKPKENELIGYWDPPGILKSDYYYIKLINHYNNKEFEKKVKIYLETNLLEGNWPYDSGNIIDTRGQLSPFRQPTIGDVNNDGKNDLVFANRNGVFVLDYKGEDISGFPVSGSFSEEGPVIVDIDNDGKNEILSIRNLREIVIIEEDGSIKKTFQLLRTLSVISVDDLNSDGIYEIVVGSSTNQDPVDLFVLDNNGQIMPGWPQTLIPHIENYGNANIRKVSIADINKDGYKEIIFNLEYCSENVSCNGENHYKDIHVYDYKGNILSGWPKFYPESGWNFINSNIIIFDLDKDSYPDIIINDYDFIYALDYKGNNLEGFPYTLDAEYKRESNGKMRINIMKSLAGDIDNDGINEIFILKGWPVEGLYGFEYINNKLELKEGFPVKKSEVEDMYYWPRTCTFQLANFVGEENQIIVKPATIYPPKGEMSFIHIFDSYGNLVYRLAVDSDYGEESSYQSIPVGDLDGDGDNEVVFYGQKNIIVYDLEGDSEKNLWGQYFHDSQHTGNYHFERELRPSSTLTNNANNSITGTLKLILQKDVSGNWQDIQTITDQQVNIPANGFVELKDGKDNLGNQVFAGWNDLDVNANSPGDFRVYASFESNSQLFEDSYKLKVQ